MRFWETLRDSLLKRATEATATAVVGLLIWASYELAPALLFLVSSPEYGQSFLVVFIASLAINLILTFVVWRISNQSSLKLKYGAYWDKGKNPHCPTCQKPIGNYSEYDYGTVGYLCRSCNNIVSLTDAMGNKINPERAISEL
jgi:hypothetical protein